MIVDASVAVAWYVELPWSGEARNLVPAPRLQAPDLILAETANALWKYVRADRLAEELAVAALDHLATAVVQVPASRMMREALALAIARDHPIYDCLYVELARHGDEVLVTADRRLAALAERAGIACRHLG